MLSAGYHVFAAIFNSGSPGYFPLKAGVKYYEYKGLFFSGEAGVILNSRGEPDLFVWSPGVGYTFKDGFELSERFEGWPNSTVQNLMCVRAAIRF